MHVPRIGLSIAAVVLLVHLVLGVERYNVMYRYRENILQQLRTTTVRIRQGQYGCLPLAWQP